MTTALTLYGITNCSTVKKARAWLDQQHLSHTFHDFKKSGINREHLTDWARKAGWETLLNRRGTTWRQLPDIDKARVVDQASAIDLMLDKPSVIKRPVLTCNDTLLVGFDASTWHTFTENTCNHA